MVKLDHGRLRELIAAGEAVDRESLIRFHWNAASGCESPVTLEHFAKPGPIQDLVEGRRWFMNTPGLYYRRNHDWPVWLIVKVPCRKCAACLRIRAATWRERAFAETKAAPRTWLCTFTLTHDEQYRALLLARKWMAERSRSFEEESEPNQFCARVRAINPEITRYVKRVRKQSGASLRYLWVAERHMGGGVHDGLPHFHALFHEVDETRPLRKSVLKEQWRLGFSTFKLAEPHAAYYLCKYLSKDLATRVRGSLKYGQVEYLDLDPSSSAKARLRDVTTHDTTRGKLSSCDRGLNEGEVSLGIPRSV